MKTSMMGKAVYWEPHIFLGSLRSPVCLQYPQELQTGFSRFIRLNTSVYEHTTDELATVSPLVMYKYFKDYFPWKNGDKTESEVSTNNYVAIQIRNVKCWLCPRLAQFTFLAALLYPTIKMNQNTMGSQGHSLTFSAVIFNRLKQVHNQPGLSTGLQLKKYFVLSLITWSQHTKPSICGSSYRYNTDLQTLYP